MQVGTLHLQDGERGERELQLYSHVERLRSSCGGSTSGNHREAIRSHSSHQCSGSDGDESCRSAVAGCERHAEGSTRLASSSGGPCLYGEADVLALSRWIPCSCEPMGVLGPSCVESHVDTLPEHTVCADAHLHTNRHTNKHTRALALHGERHSHTDNHNTREHAYTRTHRHVQHPRAFTLPQKIACTCTVGTRTVEGRRYLILEDLAAGYRLPCVLDAKVGLQTWYPWGPQALISKYRCRGGLSTWVWVARRTLLKGTALEPDASRKVTRFQG
jgi:hypothetical protein